ncbi:glycosyltransferase [Erwinia aphidicola]|uniref:glycosyltransferase n=1 Tax=Erwinia aphidicola TaxID=68334 RepID=UPI00300DA523
MKVEVIMATYNANGFVIEQIESILNQTHSDLRLLIRDDGSSDSTLNDIKKICELDSRVKLIQDDFPSNGVGENFKRLLCHCSADYVFLADQDDVWDHFKIEKLLSHAISNDDNSPLIAYAPGQVTNSILEPTGAVTDDRLRITRLEDLYLMNGGVQGCAMVINKALYTLALEDDFFWYMHDQVLSLYAVTYGKIIFYSESLFKYRQHSTNVLGFNSSGVSNKFKRYFYQVEKSFLINKHTYNMFDIFLKSRSTNLPIGHKKSISSFLTAISGSKKDFFLFAIRKRLSIKHSFLKAIAKVIIVKNLVEIK